jgi:hypothetical protein
LADGFEVQPALLQKGQIMGDYDKGQDTGKDENAKPDFDKQQEQEGGKPDQGQDKGGDFGGKEDDESGGKPDQQQ